MLTNPTAPCKRFTGARPTPRHKLLWSYPFRPAAAPPSQVAYVPTKLDYWGNNQYGDCVTAEEAFAKATYQPEIFIDSQTVENWAQQGGFLNGADLQSVLQAMQQSGFQVGSQLYNDGSHQGVDFSQEPVLQAAIAQGPVKIAIASADLPSTAGNQQGWYAVGAGRRAANDHCVSLCGYGPAQWLYQQLGVPLPSALQPTQQGYLLFTWSTIGFVDHAWIMGTTDEAWVRNPTTVGIPPLVPPPPPTPPTPTPTPIPTPPPTAGWSGTITLVNGVVTAITPTTAGFGMAASGTITGNIGPDAVNLTFQGSSN